MELDLVSSVPLATRTRAVAPQIVVLVLSLMAVAPQHPQCSRFGLSPDLCGVRALHDCLCRVASGAAYASTSSRNAVGRARQRNSLLETASGPRLSCPFASWFLHGSGGGPWPTPGEAPSAAPTTPHGTILLDRGDCIVAARRLEAAPNAGPRETCRDSGLIEVDASKHQPGRPLFRRFSGEVPAQYQKQGDQDGRFDSPSLVAA